MSRNWARKGAWGASILVALAACNGSAPKKRSGAGPRASDIERAESANPAPSAGPLLGPVAGDGLYEIDGPGLIAQMRASGRKATLLNVWASWCGSCRGELPMLVDLGSALEKEGVGLMLVSVDKPEDRKAAVALLDKLSPRPTSYVVQGPLGPFKRAINPAWKGALPATGLYDEKGELLWFWPSAVFEHEVTTIITQYLAGEPLQGPVLPEPDPR